MYLESFFVEGLGHQSYLVGPDQSPEVFVVDPRRDTQVYVDAALRVGVNVRYVLETHVPQRLPLGGQSAGDPGGSHARRLQRGRPALSG